MLKKVCGRDFGELLLKSRDRLFGVDPEIERSVREILEEVRRHGDSALIEYTSRFDGVELQRDDLKVRPEEIDLAHSRVNPSFLIAFREAAENVRRFHAWQLPRPFVEVAGGFVRGWLVRPVRRVGVYAPGGKAAYPSSLMMGVIPTQLAGVKDVIVCSPPAEGGEVSPLVLAACKELGVDSVYRVGGPQAIGAMAYGTETIPRVDIIVGPGNLYVTVAKKLLYGEVGIDLLAGPSEIAIITDSKANSDWIAMDLIAQAEHDEEARVLLISPDERAIDASLEALCRLARKARRWEIVKTSLENGFAVLVEDLDEAVVIVNEWAPEHLQLYVEEPFEVLEKVERAGAVFLGGYGTVPFGDYWAGPNHILPTGGSGRFMSGVGVDTFVRKMCFLFPSREGFLQGASSVVSLAEAEGLFGHAEAVRVRCREDGGGLSGCVKPRSRGGRVRRASR